MPASIIAQAVIELFGSLIGEVVSVGAQKAVIATQDALEERRRRRRERALACADLVVLAAYHDRVVTEAERRVLAEACEEAFARADIEVPLDALLARWGEKVMSFPNERAFDAQVLRVAGQLERSDARWVLRAVDRLAATDVREEGGFRDPAPTARRDTAARFRALIFTE